MLAKMFGSEGILRFQIWGNRLLWCFTKLWDTVIHLWYKFQNVLNCMEATDIENFPTFSDFDKKDDRRILA